MQSSKSKRAKFRLVQVSMGGKVVGWSISNGITRAFIKGWDKAFEFFNYLRKTYGKNRERPY
jgi:hypothetical protein